MMITQMMKTMKMFTMKIMKILIKHTQKQKHNQVALKSNCLQKLMDHLQQKKQKRQKQQQPNV